MLQMEEAIDHQVGEEVHSGREEVAGEPGDIGREKETKQNGKAVPEPRRPLYLLAGEGEEKRDGEEAESQDRSDPMKEVIHHQGGEGAEGDQMAEEKRGLGQRHRPSRPESRAISP